MSRDLEAMRRDYSDAPLRRTDLAGTWLEQLERWIDEAVRAELPEPNAMVLATADVDGVPSARTVLLKGLNEHGLAFFTNLRSRKGRELDANPRAAAVFPWIDLHRQVIVDGAVEPLAATEADAYFSARPRGAQLGALASEQSRLVESRTELEALYREAEGRHPDRVPRPGHWGGLRLRPDAVEFWQGRRNRLHDRLRFRHTAGEWVVERLAP